MVRGKNPGRSFLLGQYVNDRPYVASSFMSVAIAQVFGSALRGRCKDRPALVATPIPLEARLDVLSVRGGENVLRVMFEPLGHEVGAVRHLAVPEWAVEMAAALKYFHGSRYDLIVWVVMPSHYHWVFRPLTAWVDSLGPEAQDRSPRQRIRHSVKRHSAKRCNELLRRQSDFWQREPYDHWVRDADELRALTRPGSPDY